MLAAVARHLIDDDLKQSLRDPRAGLVRRRSEPDLRVRAEIVRKRSQKRRQVHGSWCQDLLSSAQIQHFLEGKPESLRFAGLAAGNQVVGQSSLDQAPRNDVR